LGGGEPVLPKIGVLSLQNWAAKEREDVSCRNPSTRAAASSTRPARVLHRALAPIPKPALSTIDPLLTALAGLVLHVPALEGPAPLFATQSICADATAAPRRCPQMR
jgi:hypothetical protein